MFGGCPWEDFALALTENGGIVDLGKRGGGGGTGRNGWRVKYGREMILNDIIYERRIFFKKLGSREYSYNPSGGDRSRGAHQPSSLA